MALKRRSKPAPQNDFFPGFADIAEIGVGSLATVYRARELGTDRQVALKLLNVRDASPRALESFERESLALGAVSSHPNIVTLYRSFRAADGRPVLVLELCRGSVGDRMHGGAGLPVAEVVALGIKIAGALETAHRAEILHRDVKPQNILMTEFGEPALADFGVAMLQSSTQTTAGLFDFTTLHAAPELLEGGETSAATDVYELASSLYQLIAGRAAFRAYDGESPASVILRILRDPVQPLVNTQAPASLSDLLVYAMSKDKASRPPTAAEFASELAAVEVQQQWPRTQFLIRDARGGSTGLPTITRMPDLGHRGGPPGPPPAPVPAPPSFAPPPVASAPPPAPAQPVDDGWSTPTVVSRHRALEGAAPDDAEPDVVVRDAPPVAVSGSAVDDAAPDEAAPDETVVMPAVVARPTHERILVERQVIERLVFDTRPATSDGWSDVHIVQARPDASPSDSGHVDAVPVGPTDTQPEAWAPPPPPDVVEAAVPRPSSPDTRVVQLADAAALFGPAPEEPAEAERAEAERVEAERVEAERAEAARLENERVEAERVAAEQAEAQRVEAAPLQAAQVEAEPTEPEPGEATQDEASWLPPEPAAPAALVAPVDPSPAGPGPEQKPPAPVEPDFPSIWGDVPDLVPLPPAGPPPLLPPDPSTRIPEGPDSRIPLGATVLPPTDPIGPTGPSEPEPEPEQPENALPFVPWRGAVAEPDPFDTGEHHVDRAAVHASSGQHDTAPQYPIPPSGTADESAPSEHVTGGVPTWAFRAATAPPPAGPASYGDLALDPMSLRSKVTIRSGTSSLVVDGTGLSIRALMRRSAIPWSDIRGFEPRFDEAGRDGRLVALTSDGPVELAATRRASGEVRYIHALLDAYRQRAAILGQN